ncbi:hypothetical protein [Cohnella abietis]|uniref:Knr4/Smi1-like domain-containing protein n=1 Tax=Cohnella abietis TaxID=2507935 RepID=A0A3T1D8C2_9BACL|nr:hypothetical protein [Cohnella abietis]BBI34337.1 hypothetical protein KCTCHS21_37360 [Cohnella abietis]
MKIPESFRKQREQCEIDSFSFGLCNIIIFRIEQLEAAQVGYAETKHGDALYGKEKGDWQNEWKVIGYEDLCGDPIFIDGSSDQFPVYTASHGEGTWSHVPIASSFANFVEILKLLEQNAKNYSDGVFKAILNENPDIDINFWRSILD